MPHDTSRGALDRWVFALDASDTGAWELNLVDGSAWRSIVHDRIFGYTKLEPAWSYDRFLEHVIEPDRAQVDEAFRHALRDRTIWRVDCRVRRVDGEQRWITARGRVHSNDQGQPTRMWGTVQDITERKGVEHALRESERRYRTLFESMGEGFCVIERIEDSADRPSDFLYVEANPAFAAQSGLQDVVGRTIRQVVPAESEAWFQIYDRVLRTGVAERFERCLESQGRILELYAFRVEDETRRRVAIIFTDVTARKRSEQLLREADQAKNEFLAVLGHELRNPLAPLRSGLELLAEVPQQPARLDGLRAMLDRQLSHLVRLVDDLLDLSRISLGRIDLQHAPVDLNTAVETAIEQVRWLIDERRHHLVVTLSDRPLLVDGDFERLTQVASNLLSNAAKYSDVGGTIRITTVPENGRAMLRVRDTGYGIPPEQADKLFKLFSQISEHRAHTGGGGLGIGLALSRQLVEMHGGSIELASEGLGHGSEFTVGLPITTSPPALQAAPADPTAAPMRRVLIVDDNVDAAEGLRMLVELDGHRVQAVHDGTAALEQITRLRPEIVLLDLGLPGMDGLEVARRIRAAPSGSDMRLIAVTGWGQDEDRLRTRAAGFDDHLTKPITARQLRGILESPAPARFRNGC